MTMFAHTATFQEIISHSRVLIDCGNASCADAMDNLVKLCRMHQIGVSVLDSRASSLISNISVFENLWIQSAWHNGCSPVRLRTILSELLDLVTPELFDAQEELYGLLHKRPSELSPYQRCSVVLLRAMLIKPRLVVISSEWLADLMGSEKNPGFLEIMDVFFPQSTLVAFPSPALMGALYFNDWARLSTLRVT